jgi:hypothetical protein
VFLVGPQASAIRLEGGWDVGAGGLALAGWRGPGRIALLAAGTSGLFVSQRGGGRLAGELVVGIRAGGALAGLAVGPLVELDRVRPPRAGAQATAWLSAGVAPFVRLAGVRDTGSSVEIGVAVALPTLRW